MFAQRDQFVSPEEKLGLLWRPAAITWAQAHINLLLRRIILTSVQEMRLGDVLLCRWRCRWWCGNFASHFHFFDEGTRSQMINHKHEFISQVWSCRHGCKCPCAASKAYDFSSPPPLVGDAPPGCCSQIQQGNMAAPQTADPLLSILVNDNFNYRMCIHEYNIFFL